MNKNLKKKKKTSSTLLNYLKSKIEYLLIILLNLGFYLADLRVPSALFKYLLGLFSLFFSGFYVLKMDLVVDLKR
jgi:hypothetical protein